MKKTVGGKIITVVGNEELITWQTCDMPDSVNSIVLGAFYVRNEDTKDIYVKLNGGSEVLLKSGEIIDVSGLTHVVSCIVTTANARVRWGGLI